MKIISHRANLYGPNTAKTSFGKEVPENHPEAILLAEALGFMVEVDVHGVNGRLVLGHDEPLFEAPEALLNANNCIFHAKNLEAIPDLIGRGLHWFWHQEDKLTMTSRGLMWCYPGTFISDKYHVATHTILLDFGVRAETLKYLEPWRDPPAKHFWGVCTDYPYEYLSR